MGSRIPKRQHYVPKFYLKEFATIDTYGKKDKAQIHIYDIKDEKKAIRSIKTIAYGQYLLRHQLNISIIPQQHKRFFHA